MGRPNFSFEKRLWRMGYEMVAGCDEVGRGSFAGPVVAGCVIFPSTFKGTSFKGGVRIDDSKKLTAKQRQKASYWIRKNSLAFGLGVVNASFINKVGMTKATQSAFRKAIANANKKLKTKGVRQIDYLLLDAFYIPYVKGIRLPNRKARKRKRNKAIVISKISGRQLAIVNGDEKSISIAAASIIAKVYRDKIMVSLAGDKRFKVYGWEKNKGYGTKSHIKAIQKYGLTRYHRKLFLRNILNIKN